MFVWPKTMRFKLKGGGKNPADMAGKAQLIHLTNALRADSQCSSLSIYWFVARRRVSQKVKYGRTSVRLSDKPSGSRSILIRERSLLGIRSGVVSRKRLGRRRFVPSLLLRRICYLPGLFCFLNSALFFSRFGVWSNYYPTRIYQFLRTKRWKLYCCLRLCPNEISFFEFVL